MTTWTCTCGKPARFTVERLDGVVATMCAACRSDSLLTFNVHELDGRPVSWCEEHEDCTDTCYTWAADAAGKEGP